MRIGVCPYPLPAGRASAPQDVVNSGAPSAQVYCDEIGSIRPGSLFLTLPTRGLTGQHLISSEGGMVDPVQRRSGRRPTAWSRSRWLLGLCSS